jgi:hypothetical protein
VVKSVDHNHTWKGPEGVIGFLILKNNDSTITPLNFQAILAKNSPEANEKFRLQWSVIRTIIRIIYDDLQRGNQQEFLGHFPLTLSMKQRINHLLQKW